MPAVPLGGLKAETARPRGKPGQAGAFVIASLDDRPDVGYLDDQAEGKLTSDVAALWRTWDTLRSVALPRDLSIALLRAREWLT